MEETRLATKDTSKGSVYDNGLREIVLRHLFAADRLISTGKSRALLNYTLV
jgi:hypothetical protein